jgi:hypothetical protein
MNWLRKCSYMFTKLKLFVSRSCTIPSEIQICDSIGLHMSISRRKCKPASLTECFLVYIRVSGQLLYLAIQIIQFSSEKDILKIKKRPLVIITDRHSLVL